MQNLSDITREFLEYYFSQIHTSFPGVIVEYDAGKRRATVQPSLKRRAGNKEYIHFPMLIDVPVQFPGTKKYTFHLPLEKGDEVAVFFSERALEAWKDMGQDGIEDPDPRRFDLCDAYCTPGLQPQQFIDATADGLDKGLSIIHKTAWDGDLIDSVLIDDDKIEVIRKQDKKDNYSFVVDKDHMETVFKKDDTLIAQTTVNDSKAEVLYKDISSAVMKDADITVKYKKKCQVKMEDDHLTANTEKCTVDMTADVVIAKNSQITAKLNASKASVKNGGIDMYTVVDKFMDDIINSKFVGSPSQHVISPPDIMKLKQDQSDFGQIMEAG
jgi:hypothetical protein